MLQREKYSARPTSTTTRKKKTLLKMPVIVLYVVCPEVRLNRQIEKEKRWRKRAARDLKKHTHQEEIKPAFLELLSQAGHFTQKSMQISNSCCFLEFPSWL